MPEIIWIKFKKQELQDRMKGNVEIDRREIRQFSDSQENKKFVSEGESATNAI